MAKLLSLSDIYNKFAFEWSFSRDLIQWQSPVELLLGDLSFYESGDHFANRLSIENLQKRMDAIHEASNQRAPYKINYEMRVKGNQVATIEETGRVFFNPQGQMLLCRGYIKSLSIRDQKENEYLASVDIIEKLNTVLKEGDAAAVNAAFIYFSVDRVPLIAIRFGMEAVFQLMRDVCDLLERMTRSYDTVGQISGTSYGIVLQKCGHNEIIVVAKRLVDVLEQTPFEICGQKITISASIGGCVIQRSEKITAETILQHSERALLDAQHIKKISVAPSIAAKKMQSSASAASKKRREEDFQPVNEASAGS
ncbi:MAG: diguanylate cyclase [Alphaproteobacteria bacterium]|nr:diguanylate cyclase [Alphaproteobacteria bacterium]